MKSARKNHLWERIFIRRDEISIGRANRIENYDTVSIKAKLENGAEILYLASHAVKHTQNPMEETLHKAYETNQPADFLETTTKRSLKTALS